MYLSRCFRGVLRKVGKGGGFEGFQCAEPALCRTEAMCRASVVTRQCVERLFAEAIC